MRKILLLAVTLSAIYSSAFANLTQGHWRWRNNNGTQTSATWAAGQDTAITINNYKAIRLRAEVYNSLDTPKTLDIGLQYATSLSGPWTVVTNASELNAFTFGGDNAYITNGTPTTAAINDPTYPFSGGQVVTSYLNVINDAIPNATRHEYEWCIKPTKSILPNTTYYFRSNAGGDQSVLPSLTTGSSFTTPTQLVQNGGFEQGLTGWTPTLLNGSAANFYANASKVHSGAKALQVTVTNKSNNNSVLFTSTPFAVTPTHTYLLRFWATTLKRNALFDVDIKSSAGDNTCHYQLYNQYDTTGTAQQFYQYAFKVNATSATLQLNFNSNTTYHIDDIQIIDDTDPTVDVLTQYNWQNNFQETYGWLSGDNNNPVLLPDGRRAWIFSDSFIGNVNPHSNVLNSSYIINNMAVIQNGNNLTSLYGGSTGNANALFSPNDGNLFWNSGGIVENNKLKVMLIEISGGNYNGNTWIGSLSLPDLKVTGLVRLPNHSTTSPNTVFADGAYDYLYFGESTSTFENHTKVARVPAGQLDSQTAWSFYAGNNTWTSDFSKAQWMTPGSVAGSVVKLGPNNYVMSTVPNLSNQISVWFARSPVGPWVNQTLIYNIPTGENILAYEGHIDVGSNKGDGVYTLTSSLYPFVSDNSVDFQVADKETYIPVFVKANLLKLSPFTVMPSGDSILSVYAHSVFRHVTLNWVTAKSDDSYFLVQNSTDNVNWKTVASVPGNGTNNNLTQFENPQNGINYYRIISFDVDKKETISPTGTYTIKSNAVVTNFTATAAGTKVNLAFGTSSELFMDKFTILKSTDSVTFTNAASVTATGTINDPESYTAVDNSPVVGKNYYVLISYTNGVAVRSNVKVVTIAAASTALLVTYPNPTTSNISFGLSGYTGTAVTVTVSNMFGKVMSKETITLNNSQYYTLKTKPAAGNYIMNIEGVGLSKASKVIVE